MLRRSQRASPRLSQEYLRHLIFTTPSNCRCYSKPPHFYSNKQLELYASRKANRLSLRQLLFFGRSMNEERLIKSANYVRTELPVRIAHRIRDMQGLPYVVVTEEHVARIYDLYWTAFEKLRHYPQVNTMKDNDAFCVFLRSILNEHAAAIPTLSLGLSISSPYLAPDELDNFMRKMLVSRISRRVLAEHHLALTDGLLGLSVKRAMDTLIKFLQDGHHDARFTDLAVLPEIIIDGDLDTSFSYIREHLEYIILELLMNAVRFTGIQIKNRPDLVPGVIRATISSDENEVIVRISDQGGGLMLYDSQIPSDLYSFSHHRNSARLDVDRIDALRTLSLSKHGYWGKVNEVMAPQESSSEESEESELEEQPSKESEGSEKPITEGDARFKSGLQRMGMGLPLSNVYATYFGGSLDIVSLDGWGTDMYLRLPRLGTNLEGIEV